MSIERLIVGVDGSAGSRRAVEWTASLARSLGAHVVAIHAYSPLAELEHAGAQVDFEKLRDTTEDRARHDWCAPLAAAGVTFEVVLVDDEPVSGIVTGATLRQADLLVVGSHGHTGWRERVLGGVASSILDRAPCAVTIVPAPREG